MTLIQLWLRKEIQKHKQSLEIRRYRFYPGGRVDGNRCPCVWKRKQHSRAERSRASPIRLKTWFPAPPNWEVALQVGGGVSLSQVFRFKSCHTDFSFRTLELLIHILYSFGGGGVEKYSNMHSWIKMIRGRKGHRMW